MISRANCTGFAVFLALLSALAPVSAAQPHRPLPQEAQTERSDEIVADLATGNASILIGKNAIVAGVLGIPAEPGAYPPQIVELADRRLAILYGAVEWKDLDSKQTLASFTAELPGLHPSSAAAAAPHLGEAETGGVAVDIEALAMGVADRLRGLVARLHSPLNLPSDQPVFELVLADYIEDYGPEVWTISYSVKQTELMPDYWQTDLQPPKYDQLWPPDKGAPHTLVETAYPSEFEASSLLALLRGNDARLKSLVLSSNAAEARRAVLAGETRKLAANESIPFLQETLSKLAGASGNFALAVIGENTGFAWIVRPKSTARPKKAREAGAPTLERP